MFFTDSDLDILREIGNIGAGNAAGALSNMINAPVDLGVPHCDLIPYSKVTDVLEGPESVVVGILVQMSGDLEGFILMVHELKNAIATVKMLTGEEIDVHTGMNLSVLEPMKEVANILVGSYLSAISTMTNLSIMPSVPDMTVDMAMAIMNVPVIVYGSVSEYVLRLETEFGGNASELIGHFFLMPTVESFNVLKKALFE